MIEQEALNLLKQKVQNQNLIKHCLAVGAILAALARHFNQDKEKWRLAGLLHDIDYQETKDNPQEHSLIGAKMLEELGVDKEICQAVKAHNEIHGIPFQTILDKALFVSDPLTGFFVAAVFVLPSNKIADLTTENIINRFKEKSFARGSNRQTIKKCQELLGLSLEQFIEIGLGAMKEISLEIGL